MPVQDSELVKLIKLLEGLRDGDIDVVGAELKYEKIEWDMLMPELHDILGNLYHYFLDEETRKKHSEYEDMQKSELDHLIRHLHAKDWAAANAISFLQPTSTDRGI